MHGPLVAALRAGATIEHASGRQLPGADLLFYAIIVGDTPEDRTVFIRRANPRRSLRGKVFGLLRNDTLEQVDEPLFGFDDKADLVVAGNEMLILSQTAFAALFRDNTELRALVPAWSGTLAGTLPFADGSLDVLNDKALRDTRLRTRLEAAATKPVPSMAELRDAMVEFDFDPDDHIKDGKLVVTATSVRELLPGPKRGRVPRHLQQHRIPR